MRAFSLILLVAVLAVGTAKADPVCRAVEVAFKPAPNLQIAVWVEDPSGTYKDTIYISRSTGSLGLGNRPGNHGFNSDYRFPYGRRDTVLPVWAHKRNHRYGYVVMGGLAGNSISACAAYGQTHPGVSGSECDDQTIGYHFSVSSPEGFYCSPRGGVMSTVGGMDVMSCASSFYGSKGAYAPQPLFSLYPPRADLSTFIDAHDGPDARAFSSVNDLVLVSGATPPGDQVLSPPLRWTPPADGHYVLWIEMSAEGDFNSYYSNTSPNLAPFLFPDEHSELAGYGKNPYGQPSVVYQVPFTVGDSDDVEAAASYVGYGDWDGSTGTLHPPDMTINDVPGSGAGRLLDMGGSRVQVRARATCGPVNPGDGGMNTCSPPDPPTDLTVTPADTSMALSFRSAASGALPDRFDVRYRVSVPITDQDFATATPANMAPVPGLQGSSVAMMLTGLKPQSAYYVAVRSQAMCGAVSLITSGTASTVAQKFTTLHGCFIATAAYGTPLEGEVDALRRLRDRHLLSNPLGRIAVASYYALSPPLARAISSDEPLRAAARALLSPVVDAARALEQLEQTRPALLR